jgi:hypothetical protein
MCVKEEKQESFFTVKLPYLNIKIESDEDIQC